ncbi:unnamed protein product [Urochloa decumbens]|uniref:DUF1618 domain-containing protein n=1 Tax=Urochloa decumbens TaxID=240449 RepID=A0ABC8WAU1_9POAL
MPWPAAQERWSILAVIPKVVPTPETKKGKRRPAITISVDLNKPPNASILTVPRRVSSAPNNIWYPCIAAADPSGLLLLRATEPFTSFSCMCTGKVAAIPWHFQTMCLHGKNAGLLRRGRRDCMVAELRPTHDGTGRATLLCFTAGKYNNWVEKQLTYSPPFDRHYFAEGVISHGGMLWWVDLSYGILACARAALCRTTVGPRRAAARGSHQPRHLPLREGERREAEARTNPRRPQCAGGHRVGACRPGSGGGLVPSFHERTVAMADVWDDQSYKDTSLPQSIPTLALIHPMNPDKVYFFISSCIFAVDLRRKKVVEFGEFSMPKLPPHLKRSSHFVHVWKNDPSCRPDVLPSCFNKDNFSIGPDTKKLIKRFEAAHRRATAAKPVTFPAAQSRLTTANPVATHGNGMRLKAIRDHESREMEELQAKRMKFEAVLSEAVESHKKFKTMKEGDMSP